jgi:transcriptional regulator with XRE-family HTH domain
VRTKIEYSMGSIKGILENHGMSYSRLAHEMSTPSETFWPGQLHALTTCNDNPTYKTLKKLANALRIQITISPDGDRIE